MLNRFFSAVIAVITPSPAFYSQDVIRNSPYWLPFYFYGFILGNFVLDPAINNSLIDISRYCQHAVRRNSTLKRLEGGSNPFT